MENQHYVQCTLSIKMHKVLLSSVIVFFLDAVPSKGSLTLASGVIMSLAVWDITWMSADWWHSF